MDRSTKKRAAILGSFLILVGLFAVNALVGMTVRFMRIDLTQGLGRPVHQAFQREVSLGRPQGPVGAGYRPVGVG